MTYMDNVEVIVEKEKYTRDGVHKGMQGWITEPENISGYWLVNFPQCSEKNDIATIPVMEEDMKVVPIMNAAINEEIKARFESSNETDGDNLSDYMV